MRHGRVVVLAVVALTGLTGCADRPNNLDTYYDNAPTTPTTPPTLPSPAATPSDAGQVSSRTNTDVVAQDVVSATLTDADVASEGVHPATTPGKASACMDAVPAGDPRTANWQYPNGSYLSQQVTGYLDRAAAEVLAQVQCSESTLTLPVPQGADAARGWCEAMTCTVLLAGGHVLSALQVTAGTASRAAETAKRLAPIAAKKLP